MFHVLTVTGRADAGPPPAVQRGPTRYPAGFRHGADHVGGPPTDRRGPETHRVRTPVVDLVGASPKPFFSATVHISWRLAVIPAHPTTDFFGRTPASHTLSRSGHRNNGRGFQ
jgi:hypothetical protein